MFPAMAAIALVIAVLLVLNKNMEVDGMNAKDPKLVELGKILYLANCADSCHGAKLEGQPDWRTPLAEGGLPAPPHDASGHTWHHDDELLFKYVKLGGAAIVPEGFKSRMPGFGEAFSDQEIWAILSYIKSTWPENIQRQQEMRNQ